MMTFRSRLICCAIAVLAFCAFQARADQFSASTESDTADATETAPATSSEVPRERPLQPPSAYDLLGERLQGRLQELGWGGGRIGVMVMDVPHRVPIFGHNESAMMSPGETLKLLTALAAVEQLGPDFRFETELLMRGEVSRRTLKGDLIVRGTGDPSVTTLAGERPDAVDRFFSSWIAELKRRGVRKIEGGIYVDDTHFDGDGFPPGWPTKELGDPAVPEISAVNLNDNAIDIYWESHRKENEIARRRVVPPISDYVQISNNVRVSDNRPNRRQFWRFRSDAVIGMRGFIPTRSQEHDRVTVPTPSQFFGHVFREYLKQADISVDGPVLLWAHAAPAVKQTELTPLVVTQSPPLGDLLERMFRPGRNLEAEVLLKTLGFQSTGDAGSFADGARVLMNYLRRNTFRSSGAVVVDGSGVSSFDRLSARNLATLMSEIHRSPQGHHIVGAMPEIELEALPAGVDDSVAAGETSPPVHGIFSPTPGGYAAAGWVVNSAGSPVHFAFLIEKSTLPADALRHQIELLIRDIADSRI